MGVKYFSRYRTNTGVVKEIRLYKDGYESTPIEWLCEKVTVDTDYGSSDSIFPDNPIVTSQKRFNFIFEQNYDFTEFVFDRKTFFVEIVLFDDDKVEWSGWIEPWDAARPDQKPPYAVNLTASCGLAHLAKKRYINPNNVFKKTGLNIIQDCLGIIGSDLNLRTSTHMKENSFGEDHLYGLRSFEINTARYYNSNGEAMYCDDIINDILNKFNAEILQWDNRWVVRAIVDHATGYERTFHEYGDVYPSSPWPNTYLVNDGDAFTEDGSQIRILAPITKYRTEVDLGEQIPYFENGNMVLWTDDGLVGWDFSHMPKGSPGWERDYLGGDPDNASVLKISGKAPGPYEKKRKKTLGQIIGQIAISAATVGTVQWTINKKSYHVEPSEWIESSAGRVSPGDKKITISFDYETEPFSSNIIIALRFPSATNPAINYWRQPFQENIPYSQEYCYMIVPPLDREGVIGRGHIDVSGNPNYPDGNIPGWTYVIYGIPDGETRKIGGASGVIVENDDIIISKVSNPGGTQAAVGASWEVINIRVNIQKGTFEIPIDFTLANEKLPIPVEEIFIRFYKITEHPDKTGDWYKIHNLKGTIEGFVAKDDASKYATTLERGGKTDEEATTINLITGDYNPWYSGSLTKPGSIEVTSSWSRRPDLIESLSVYRAMMLDRLCLTSRPLNVFEGNIVLTDADDELTYLHTIRMMDFGGMRMRIVRYSFNDSKRIAKVTAVQVLYEEVPVEELRQDSYIPGSRLLNPVSGQGDGIYPTKQDSSSGRLSAEEAATTDDLVEAVGNNGRLGAIFDITAPLTYIAKEKSTDSINLAAYVTDAFNDLNEDQEEEDIFDLNTLVWTLTSKPSWLTGITIVFLDVTATALAPEKGMYYLYYDVMDPESELVFEVKIPIRVLEQVKVTPSLINGLTAVKSGTLPGSFKLDDPVDILTTVKGYHNNVKLILTGPDGELLNEFIYAPGTESELADYLAFPGTSGITLVEGLYKLTVEVHSNMIVVFEKDYFFTLYTEEYLSKLKFELWNTVKIGDISIQDTSIFKPVVWFTPRAIADDIEHDKVTLTLYFEGDQIAQEVFTHTATFSGTYDVYDTAQTGQDAGDYRINAAFELGGDVVMERQNDFTILAKDPVADGTIVFGTMTANTANFTAIQDLPVSAIQIDLPDDGYNFLCKGVGGLVDYVKVEFFRKISNQYSLFDLTKYTKKPDYVTFSEPTLEFELLAFDILSSLDIADLHEAPSGVRVRFTGRNGGESGQIVGIRQADVNFRVPVDPADLSGLRFINIEHGTGAIQVIDPNMKKVGGLYALPEYPWLWSAAFRKLPSGLAFDRIVGKLTKGWVTLHNAADYVFDYEASVFKGYPLNETTELNGDDEAYVYGTLSGTTRTLLNPSSVPVLIDEPGDYVFTAYVYHLGVLIDTLSAAFTLALPEDIEETPEAEEGECCTSFTALIGDGSAVDYNIDHMLDTFDVHVTIRDAVTKKEVFVENEATTLNRVVVRFFEAPGVNSYIVIVEK